MMTKLPQESKRGRRRRLAKSHKRSTETEELRQEFFVWVAPWDTDPMVFDTARKARCFRRKHRREIENNFNY